MLQKLEFTENLALLVGRIMIIMGLLPSGIRKVITFDMTAAMMGGAPSILIEGKLFPGQAPLFYFPFPEVFLGFSACLDIGGSLLLIFGLKTRSVAAFLAGYCILAITIYHGNIGGPEDIRAILRNLPLVGGLLLLASTGAGQWSIDGWLRNRRR